LPVYVAIPWRLLFFCGLLFDSSFFSLLWRKYYNLIGLELLGGTIVLQKIEMGDCFFEMIQDSIR
jgi:hypothetical protein